MPDENPTAFKHFYGMNLATLLAEKIARVYPAFNTAAYLAEVAAKLEPLEMMGRVRLMARVLRRQLPPAYPDALTILLGILDAPLPDDGGMFNDGYWVLPIAQFVEEYGLDDFDASANALYEVTQRFSSEFAIRPYLVRYPDAMLAKLNEWVRDPNPHVRRLVSEGSRTRLPWGKRLEQFIIDPAPTLALIEQLKDDPSAYVRKSVANHLNDIAKDHPQQVIEVARRWYAEGSEARRALVRHALRTLIKKGDAGALAVLGYGGADGITATLMITPAEVQIPGAITLTAELMNEGSELQEVVIDFCIHFVKANGGTGAKVFKWTTRVLAVGERLILTKTHPLRPVTTRTYYRGLHRVSLQVNGVMLAEGTFLLGL
jgi:3-methyladenine DNA glycosylase AlkC